MLFWFLFFTSSSLAYNDLFRDSSSHNLYSYQKHTTQLPTILSVKIKHMYFAFIFNLCYSPRLLYAPCHPSACFSNVYVDFYCFAGNLQSFIVLLLFTKAALNNLQPTFPRNALHLQRNQDMFLPLSL